MSWECMNVREKPCPCGNGIISRESFMDDWNRTMEGPIIIECEECKKIYDVCGGYLVPKNYPKYNGFIANKKSVEELNILFDKFVLKLIKDFNKSEIEELLYKSQNYKRTRNIGCGIHNLGIQYFGKEDIDMVRKGMENAVQNYDYVKGIYNNYDNELKEEYNSYAKYYKERNKHSIGVNL